MSRRAILVVLLGLPFPEMAVIGAGCGAGQATEHDASVERDAGAYCPATLAQMNDAPCASEGLECPVPFGCEATFELVRCTCQEQRWRCVDPVGPLDAGAAPRCIDPGPAASDPCPDTIYGAQGSACTAVGRSCFYEGERCPDGIAKLDFCDCRHYGSGPLTYSCYLLPCSPPIERDAGE
jgi:hypothetical protein